MRIAVSIILSSALLLGHAAGQSAGLVVGSGNFFSPIVANLEKAVAFYGDGLGLEVSGAPSTAADNAPLRNMFGLPDAQLRWTVARPKGARQGVEIVEISGAGGKPVNRRITDPGAATLVIPTTDRLDEAVKRLTKLGGTILNAPKNGGVNGAVVAVVRDPDDHFVEVIAVGQTAAPPPPRIRLTVKDVDQAVALYRDALGLQATMSPPSSDAWLTTALGLTQSGVRSSTLEVPGSRLAIEFVQFKGAGNKVTARIQDPGSTRLQLQVRDLDAAIKAVVAAGGQVISTGGAPVEMPAGRGAPLRAAIVRDPDNLFLVLIAAQPPRP